MVSACWVLVGDERLARPLFRAGSADNLGAEPEHGHARNAAEPWRRLRATRPPASGTRTSRRRRSSTTPRTRTAIRWSGASA